MQASSKCEKEIDDESNTTARFEIAKLRTSYGKGNREDPLYYNPDLARDVKKSRRQRIMHIPALRGNTPEMNTTRTESEESGDSLDRK